jgi:hypothetical protein
MRSRWESREVVSRFADEAAAGIVSALMSGDVPDVLEARWRSMDERLCFERLARGDAVIAEGGLTAEHAPIILNDIGLRSAKRRFESLKPLVITGEATEAEKAEYFELAKKIKGRRR